MTSTISSLHQRLNGEDKTLVTKVRMYRAWGDRFGTISPLLQSSSIVYSVGKFIGNTVALMSYRIIDQTRVVYIVPSLRFNKQLSLIFE